MKTEDLLNAGEKILWRCGLSLRAAFWRGVISKRLYIIFANLLITAPCLALIFSGDIFDADLLVPLFVLLGPSIACVLYSMGEVGRFASTTYCITDRGVYIQSGTGKKANTMFTPYAKIADAACKSDSLDGMLGTGTVNCILKRQKTDGVKKPLKSISLQHIEDYEQVQRVISRQLTASSAAETETVQDTPVLTASDVRDPSQAFFGTQQPVSGSESFLQPAGAEVVLPEETVADLQTELFGTNAELQGAFPDPTVNPLPKLPEVQQNPAGEFTPHSR